MGETDKALLTEKDLHSYQQFCVDFVEGKPQCALFLDCGLGKTVIALTAISHLLYDSFEVVAKSPRQGPAWGRRGDNLTETKTSTKSEYQTFPSISLVHKVRSNQTVACLLFRVRFGLLLTVSNLR